MDLIATQPQSAGREGTGPRIDGENVGTSAPPKMLLYALPERPRKTLPIDSFWGRTEGGNPHTPQLKLRVLGCCLVPNFRNASMQIVWLAMERALTNRVDELLDRSFVDVLRLDTFRVGMVRQPREADPLSTLRQA